MNNLLLGRTLLLQRQKSIYNSLINNESMYQIYIVVGQRTEGKAKLPNLIKTQLPSQTSSNHKNNCI